MTTKARARRRPVASQDAPPASNVVELRPGFTLKAVSPTPANLQVAATEKKGKKGSAGRGLQKPVSAFQAIELADHSEPANPSTLSKDEFRKLIAGMTKMQLRETFQLEANSHRGIVARCKRGRYRLHPEFKAFGRFLWHMGPRPAPDWTVDRKDPENPEYGPGLCRWASPRAQANNRVRTVRITDEAGETRPLTEWARKTGQNPKTIAKRLERGASDVEALRGASTPPVAKTPPAASPGPAIDYLDRWPPGVTAEKWETPYQDFKALHGLRLGRSLCRSVFFAWIAGNSLKHLQRRLEKEFPDFLDAYYEPTPDFLASADQASFYRLLPPADVAQSASWSSEDARSAVQFLQYKFPSVRDQGAALRVQWDELAEPAW